MNSKQQILQAILAEIPQGGIATTKWLNAKGASRSLLTQYTKSGWLKKLGFGAFYKTSDHPKWANGLQALQMQLEINIYVGGKTALEYLGHSHFVSTRHSIELFFLPGNQPPKLFRAHLWDEALRLVYVSIIHGDVGIEPLMVQSVQVLGSSRERAVLELLHLAPKLYDYEEVMLIMESMGTLRPDLLRELLSKCSSEKASRLLLYFGDVMNHSWRKYLDDFLQPTHQSLLKIVPRGGHYIAKYNLFIPREYMVTKEVSVRF